MIKNNDQQIAEYYDNQDELLNTLTYLASYGTYVFRGYNRQDQLLPNIIRDKDFSNVEAKLLNEFEKYGSHYFIANAPIDFLSFAQHYGLPTRLLDFTCNPFIALSFALFSKKSSGNYKENEDKDYYYIRYCSISDNIHLKGIPAHHQFTFGNFELDSISKKCANLLSAYSNCLSDTNNESFNDYVNGLFKCDYQAEEDFGKYKQIITRKLESKKLCFIDPISQTNVSLCNKDYLCCRIRFYLKSIIT